MKYHGMHIIMDYFDLPDELHTGEEFWSPARQPMPVFPTVSNEVELDIFFEALEKATYRRDYFLPLEYTEGFMNVRERCACLKGTCDRRDGHCAQQSPQDRERFILESVHINILMKEDHNG